MTLAEALVAFAWFVVFVVSVSVAIRLQPERSPATLAMGAALLYTALMPLAAFLPVDGNIWRALAVFCFLATCYLMIFGAVYKSVSLRMLLDLLQAPARRMPARVLYARYIETESFEARLAVMLHQGLAHADAGAYALTRKGRRLAVIARRLQLAFGIDKSG